MVASVQKLNFSSRCEFVFGSLEIYVEPRLASEKPAALFWAARRNLAMIEQDCCHS